MWESENQDESPLMTTDNFHGIDRLVIECADNSSSATGSGRVYRPAESEQNPSERRGGVTIRFWCENCHSLSELALAQHKGCSVLAWRPAGHIVCHAE
jgi:hypothetical protein